MDSPLFALGAELRIDIYERVFSNISTVKFDKTGYIITFPRLLLACRRVYREAIPIYREAVIRQAGCFIFEIENEDFTFPANVIARAPIRTFEPAVGRRLRTFTFTMLSAPEGHGANYQVVRTKSRGPRREVTFFCQLESPDRFRVVFHRMMNALGLEYAKSRT